MTLTEIIAQLFGVFGLIFTAISFQEKNNKKFFIKQGFAGFMFFMNFLIIGAVSGALFNLVNLVRGALFAKNKNEILPFVITEVLYTVCFVFSLSFIADKPFQIFLSSLTFLALAFMTIFMWKGNGKHIRYFQLLFVSPAWLIHNVFNFSLGGILCEIFAMASVVISLFRYRADGFEA